MPGHAANDAQDHRDFGRGLRLLRERAALTQAQLSERVGITVEYLSRIENGHRGARWHTVMRLLRALDATLAELGAAIDVEVAEPAARKRARARARVTGERHTRPS